MSTNDVVAHVSERLEDDPTFERFEGTGPHSEEFQSVDDDFAVNVRFTNRIEVSLHHPDGDDTGVGGFRLINVVASDTFDSTDAARRRVDAFVRWRDEIRAAVVDGRDDR